MTFPTATSSVIYNEDGEPMGWDNMSYEPEYDPNDYLDYEDEGPDVWGDPDACQAEGLHGNDLNKTNEGTLECANCGEAGDFPDPWADALNEN